MTFPFRADRPVVHDGPLPTAADVVVIGGGIIGVSTAWELARARRRVVLCEKGRVGAEQSGRNWGWIRAQGRDLAELPIVLEAQAMWPAWEKEAGSVGLAQTGTLYLAKDDREMARFADWLDQARTYQVSTRLMTAQQVSDHMPAAATRWAGGLYTPTDYRAEPWEAVPAFARAATTAGAIIREDCAVRGLDMVAGQVAGVITEKGRIAAPRVVLAGGAWSSLFLARHGVRIPQLSVRATVAATDPLADIYAGGAVDDRLAWRRRQDGGYSLAAGGFHELFLGPDAFRNAPRYLREFLSNPANTRLHASAPAGYPDGWRTPRRWRDDEVSPFERCRVLDPAPHLGKARKVADDFGATFPDLGRVGIRESWAGMIDLMPDVVPVVDAVPDLPGLIVATGMSGHGFGIGPGMGAVLARLATGRDPGHDLHRFRLSRFTDGSRLTPGPAL